MNESVYGTENSAMERYNYTHSTMFLIAYWDGYDHPEDMMIVQTKDDALEIFMSLVEEDIYIGFCCELEDDLSDETPEEMSRHWKYSDTLWQIMEVPTIYGDVCC
jgi:hypothetical protein